MSGLSNVGIPRYNLSANGKSEPALLKKRLSNFLSGRYSSYNLASLLYYGRSDALTALRMTVWPAPELDKPSFGHVVANGQFSASLSAEVRLCTRGYSFGPSWSNHWVRLEITIPEEWREHEEVQLLFDPSGEGLIFTEDGRAVQGITGGEDENRRIEYIIPVEEVRAGRCVRFIEVTANHLNGCGQDPPDNNQLYILEVAELVVTNPEAWRLKYDFTVLEDIVNRLPSNSPLANLALTVANDIMNAFDGTSASIPTCRKLAEKVLGQGWEQRTGAGGWKDPSGSLWGLGHCHIDTAWLWPWSVTKQKVARSWSTQLDLIDRYPEYNFTATSAQQYSWLEELYPDVFARVQNQVKQDRFEVLGGTWLEMDGNMPSGESFCRQFLYGQRYFKSRFGKICDIFVLPDTFGYSAQLPQIARMSGTTSFFTQKLSWNATNAFPHTTFNWVGLDGTEILTHMTPVGNYDSRCSLEDINRAHTHHLSLDTTPSALLLYGDGDGGGGPKAYMIENLRRLKVIAETHGELPAVRLGGKMRDFFQQVRKETDGGKTLASWVGELYLEFHRGTYTSQASTKRGNRKGEILLREVELFATLASIAGSTYRFPKKSLDILWEDLLRNHFHDTLPGSSIPMCVVDSDEKYRGIQELGEALLDQALEALGLPRYVHEGEVAWLNTLHWCPRNEEIGGQYMRADGASLLAQITPAEQLAKVNSAGDMTFSNGSLSIVCRNGRISSMRDLKNERELLADGTTAGFVLCEDQPAQFDAWDIEPYHLDQATPLRFTTIDVVEDSAGVYLQCEVSFPHRTTSPIFPATQSKHHQHHPYDSPSQTTRTTATVKMHFGMVGEHVIRFEVNIDWRERHRMLKFELPTSVWSNKATYDTAFGVLERETYRNTSWEGAKFEGCGHKFVDLSEHGYGVALISESKYGYSVQGNIMRLSLLRSPTSPDPECDQGRHEFSFAVYPHAGDYGQSDVQNVAFAFNTPMRKRYCKQPSNLLTDFPLTLRNPSSVILETIKRGESDFDGNEDQQSIIVRMYEHKGGRAQPVLLIRKLQVARVELVDIIEDTLEELDISTVEGGVEVQLQFRPFNIKTLKIILK